jgi:hypothetical protein
MSYDTFYHISRFTIINTFLGRSQSQRFKIEESQSEVLCTDSTAPCKTSNVLRILNYVQPMIQVKENKKQNVFQPGCGILELMT